ncbi:hypothetical protein ACIQYW_24535 [Rhodococcus erythropolis]|jgi:hypothetical protein|uniref:hypothetical protein n=2 Tax=Actinomycetes TaxID=1760 RepID=UPI000F597459|nr:MULTISPECIES: hypothetical protein [Rhodococcus]MCD2109446.1 hypothetical protein [Rhodococcus qingshengii]MCZ4528366.1 hypothetical protein [Rhodococcus erythropolis]
MTSRTELTRTLHAQWTQKRGELGFLAFIVSVVVFAISAIVMYEASSNAVFGLGAFAAACGAVCCISLVTFVALPPKPATNSEEIGQGRTFTMTAATRWASALWLWSALVSCALSFVGVGLNYATKSGGSSFNSNWWLVLGALSIGASILSPLRYVGRFRIDIDGDGMRMELGRAYSGYLRWSDIDKIETSARGRYALDLVLKPGVRVENTSHGSSLYRVGPGIITEASPFQDGYLRLECGGWTGETSALPEEIVHHVITEDTTEQKAAS